MTPDRPFLARPDLLGSFGMCASTHWIASAVGQAVLERGGNAFDAAVAAGFVLHVVEPHLNGAGGDLVGLFAPAGQPPLTLAGQAPAPRGATIEHFRAEGLGLVPGAGALAATAPGAVDAWLLLLRDHGTWEVAEVLDYAIHYARNGHQLLPTAAATIDRVAALFRAHWPTSADLWLTKGRAPEAGEIVYNTAYAETLDELCRHSVGETRAERIDAVRHAWSHGFVADAIDDFVANTPHRHSTGTDHRGVLNREDLADYTASYEEPVQGAFRDTRIVTAGAWSQGPVLLQTMAILDGYSNEELELSTGGGVHRVLEALKLALADRDAYYGEDIDPSVLETLVSESYASERRVLIGDAASRELRPGLVPGGLAPFRPPLVRAGDEESDPTVGEPTVSAAGVTRGDTCHIDIIDRWGNAISVTPSGGWLQSSPTIPSLGFALGTRLQMTWLDEASPSALLPGRRPRTTLAPTLLLREGSVVSALGTPGGDQQDQWQAVYLVRLLAEGKTPQEAIEAPAFHSTSFPQSFWPRDWEPGGAVVEGRLGAEVIENLRQRGHVVTLCGDWSLGRLSAVSRNPATGLLSAAANPRGGQGYAAGR
ncbi:gamma-glutamyltransferase family protein [Subtercola boreus]|uniref:Transferase n=1 Tax=Subtercola boreus TaxID=120213 RepID=A0A3E0W7F1_9MICO|nr:gamma-glutamyltransferase [Subtercola boreus]RFA18170.1 transferase [Subtercola boreus]RFA18552.1 transferase [Subtercola boreus]RFA25080.1 transferase [Subtercola boreus]